MRTLVIGDVHGCLVELKALLDKLSYSPGQDTLVFVGDLVDRGPDPVGVVRFVRALQTAGNVLVCVGNHDETLVRYLQRVEQERTTGRVNQMTPPKPDRLAQWQSFTPEEREWLRTLPTVIEPIPGWIAVHAGFEGDKTRDKQKPDKVVRVRWVDPITGKMVGLHGDSLDQPEGTVHWSAFWKGPENVVYGHAVHSLKNPRVDRPQEGVECWGIDTGAAYGGRLTALCLETREVVQVQAEHAYAPLRNKIVEDGSK